MRKRLQYVFIGIERKKMTKIEYNNFGEYEGYVGNEKEFWFRKIVLNEVKCHENLRKIGICDNDIARSIKSATKFKRRFKGILTQLNVQTGIEEDLKKGCILQ